MKIRAIVVVVTLFAMACQPGIARLDQSQSYFDDGVARGKIDRQIREASALVYSIKNPGLLWTINDGGNDPILYLITERGEIKKEFDLNIINRDWESLSIYYDSIKRTSFLYLGDVGDNASNKKEKIIYWFEEPEFFLPNEKIETINQLTIPVVKGMDMEAMLIDPLSHDLFLFSKREDSITLYSTNRMDTYNEPELTKVCRLPFTYVVDVAISPDGREILLKDYRNVFYWRRKKSEPISKTLLSPPTVSSYRRERQGEAISFDKEGLGYYTLSESGLLGRAKIFYYKRNASAYKEFE